MTLVDEIVDIITSTLDIDDADEGFALEIRKFIDFDRVGINTVDLADILQLL
jgi:hypothetical protein